jgi:multidrug resistance efflux pump
MKRVIPIIILLAAVGAGYWWFTQTKVDASLSTALTGSGTIEAEKVAITTEIGGRIIAIEVDEGDEVRAGQVLVEIDPANLLALQTQLAAAWATAKANLTAVSAPPRSEDIAAAQAQLAQTKAARDGAKTIWETARALVNNPHELQARLSQAQAQVTEAQKSFEQAQVQLKRAEIQAEVASRNQSSHAALVQNEVAQEQLRATQVGVKMMEVALTGVKQQVELLTQLRDHPLQLIAQANSAKAAYQQAEAAVQVAEANLTAVKAGPTQEDIAVAEAQVAEAEAALAAAQVQLDKLTLTAPRAGLVSHKSVNAGELAAPGTTLLELSDIETVDLTVYIPETQIGRVKVGQQALVFVDAYPGEVFEGTVTFITPQAEFTPRNVQTQEERVNLVFGVKITLANPDHRLKPGMPADGEILPTSALDKLAASSPTATPQATAIPTMPSPTQTSTATAMPVTVEATPTRVSTPTAEGTTATDQAEIITWGLKVRTGPGVDYPAFTHLAKGQVVTILGVDPKSGWLQVQLPGEEQTGWITNNPAYVVTK